MMYSPRTILAPFALPAAIFLLVIFGISTKANGADQAKQLVYKIDPANRGWDYLIHRLIQDEIPKEVAYRIYRDKRMPAFSLVYFSLNPKESSRLYTSFYSQKKLEACRAFLQKYENVFDAAHKRLGVSRYVIASIMLIETQLGKVTGNQSVVYRLSRLAVIGAPNNVQANIQSLVKRDKTVKAEDVIKRAKYLEDMFYPELPAVIEIAEKSNIDIFDIRGSRAGAFGYPQFLPSTYLKFALDGNQDGKISLFQYEDSIWSVSNFLSSYGWKDDLAREAKESVVWKYNHSQAYVDAVLGVAEKLQSLVEKDKP